MIAFLLGFRNEKFNHKDNFYSVHVHLVPIVHLNALKLSNHPS